MENIDKLCKLLESYQKEYIKYVLDRKEFCESQEIENQDDAKRALLKFGFLDGEFESTAREAGHLCGIRMSPSTGACRLRTYRPGLTGC